MMIVRLVIVEVPLFTRIPPVYVWRAVQVLAFPRLSEATTAPVVGEIVSVPSELETDETPVATQLPLYVRHPVVRLIPLANVDVPAPPTLSTPEV